MESPRSPSSVQMHVLLTDAGRQPVEHWAWQLSRLLEPQGVQAHVAQTGQQALALAGRLEFHAAVIDLATPVEEGVAPVDSEAWLLELFKRLPNRPPLVVVGTRTQTPNQLNRMTQAALRLGAFSVLRQPVSLNQILEVFQRLLVKRYAGAWPAGRAVRFPLDHPN